MMVCCVYSFFLCKCSLFSTVVSVAPNQTKYSVMEGMDVTFCINYYGTFETSATVHVGTADGTAFGKFISSYN